jgi:hypothetical protein
MIQTIVFFGWLRGFLGTFLTCSKKVPLGQGQASPLFLFRYQKNGSRLIAAESEIRREDKQPPKKLIFFFSK